LNNPDINGNLTVGNDTGQSGTIYAVNRWGNVENLRYNKGVLVEDTTTSTHAFDYWHSWNGGTVAIVLGVGVTQAVFPDINNNYSYCPYIQSASGTSAPMIEDIVISGTTLTVTFTAVTAQQAAGDACVIKLRTVV
jgi:hypothetical protein